jgi:hypothetical protein
MFGFYPAAKSSGQFKFIIIPEVGQGRLKSD